MTTSETIATIVMLAPSLVVFRAVHRAHRVFRVTLAQMFMVRCRWRTLQRVNIYDNEKYTWILPHGRSDGQVVMLRHTQKRHKQTYYVDDVEHGIWSIWYDGRLTEQLMTVDGKIQGDHNYWYESGQLREQCVYVDDILHERKIWYSSGQLYMQCNYVDGSYADDCVFWNTEGQQIENPGRYV